jgi:hypothetical protein
MALPVQAAPVQRGPGRGFQQPGVTQQACNWLTCAEDVARCIGSCYPNPLNPGCLSCLGPAWNDCKSCFGG